MNNLLKNFPGNSNIFHNDLVVRYSEVNQFGILKLQSLFDYLQQIAAEHANSLGYGMNSLYAKGMIWVLSKMDIKIFGTFSPEQQITVCTYPAGTERLHFRREFEIFDSKTGEVLMQSSSYWLLLNREKLRPLRRETIADVKLENPELPLMVQQSITIDSVDCPMEEILSDSVRFSQMDINQHMNNAQYAALVEDAVYEKIHAPFEIKDISVAFLQAQKYPDELQTSIYINKENKFQLAISNKSANRPAFTACGKFVYTDSQN